MRQLADGVAPKFDAGKLLGDEGIEVVAADFAVRNNVDSGVFLILDRGEHSVIGDLVEFGLSDFTVLTLAQRLNQPCRPRPGPNDSYGEKFCFAHRGLEDTTDKLQFSAAI